VQPRDAALGVVRTRAVPFHWQIGAGPEGRDVVTAILQMLAVVPFQQGIFFGPLQTCDLGERISTNSAMTGFLFAVPEGIEMGRLCSCTPSAQLVVSVITITANEIRYAKERGSERLIAQFEKAGVLPIFDPFRKGLSLPAT